MPRNAHRVSAILDPKPFPKLIPCGFHADANVWPLNQNHPIIESRPTGRITPQTVMDPICPVMRGPPKLATAVSQIRPITPRQVAIGVDDSQGKNVARYPTAEIAIATFPMAKEKKYR